MNQKIKIIFAHGNGNSTPNDNWIPWAKAAFEKLGFTVVAPQFPDALLARESYWLPFLKDELKADENTIIIGHSSGAVAATRYAEKNKLLGTVLIGTMYTDLGIETETIAGYYNRPWDWQAIKNNQQWVILFASTDDPWIPISEPRFINQQLGTDYYEFTDQGHFGGDYHKPTFPELVDAVKKKFNL